MCPHGSLSADLPDVNLPVVNRQAGLYNQPASGRSSANIKKKTFSEGIQVYAEIGVFLLTFIVIFRLTPTCNHWKLLLVY